MFTGCPFCWVNKKNIYRTDIDNSIMKSTCYSDRYKISYFAHDFDIKHQISLRTLVIRNFQSLTLFLCGVSSWSPNTGGGEGGEHHQWNLRPWWIILLKFLTLKLYLSMQLHFCGEFYCWFHKGYLLESIYEQCIFITMLLDELRSCVTSKANWRTHVHPCFSLEKKNIFAIISYCLNTRLPCFEV